MILGLRFSGGSGVNCRSAGLGTRAALFSYDTALSYLTFACDKLEQIILSAHGSNMCRYAVRGHLEADIELAGHAAAAAV